MRFATLLLWLRFATAVLAAVVPSVAHAQFGFAGVQGTKATYKGPIDAQSGATMCWSLRGCAASYNGTAATIRRQSDNTTTNIAILSNGNFDSATAASFGGVDATATCSTSGSSTTLSCTGASATPNQGDEITGAGITGPAFLSVACGTFTGGAGACTMQAAQTIASTTVTFHVALFVRSWFDQTLGANCTGTCNLVQVTNSTVQPLLLLHCLATGTLPCTAAPLSGSSAGGATVGSFTPATGVTTIVAVGERVGTGAQTVLRSNGANNRLTTAAGANTWTLTGGTSGTISATASDGAAHAVVGVINGASSNVYVDNTATAGTVTGNTTAGAPLYYNGQVTLYIGEILTYDNVALSSGQVGALHTNQSAYWGTP